MTSTPERLAAPGRAVLTLLCLAQALLIIDVVVVNVALPSIRADLAIPDGRLQLVSVGYTLTFGSLLIVFGRAGDLFGRRRLFRTGLSVFTVTSLATGLAQTEWQLIAARAGQGVGAAMIAPTALALLTTAFEEGPRRTRALGYWAAVGSAGAIGGQVLGGVVTSALGWRWIFLINVPLGAAAFLAARRHLAESTAPGRGASVNVRGAVLLAACLACAVLALTLLTEGGHPLPGGFLAATALAALAGFLASERRHATPVIDRHVLRTGHVARANLLLAVNAGTLAATLFFTTLYLQVVLGHSALEVGLAFAPITLLVLLLSPRAAALVTRFGPRLPLAAGLLCLAAGMLLLSRLPEDGDYLHDVLPPFVLLAVGSALSYSPTFVIGTSAVPPADQGTASGLLNSAQELGTSTGVALLAALAAATSAPTALATGYRTALITAATCLILCLPLLHRLPGRPKPTPENDRAEQKNRSRRPRR